MLGTADEEQYLDPTHPGARKFIRAMVRNARAEGFRYFKIDYNQVDHNCRYFNPKKTRFEAFRDLYTLYREEMGDSYLLACADYERATFGLADASRTGGGFPGVPGFRPGQAADMHPGSNSLPWTDFRPQPGVARQRPGCDLPEAQRYPHRGKAVYLAWLCRFARRDDDDLRAVAESCVRGACAPDGDNDATGAGLWSVHLAQRHRGTTQSIALVKAFRG